MVHFREPHHVSVGASEIAGAVADSDSAYGLPFPPRKLKNELALELGLRFEDSKRRTVECASPVVETRTFRRNTDRTQEAIEGMKRKILELSLELGRGHGRLIFQETF